jgi:glycosyltransferase involved in cell wall biosynthesis
MKFDPLPWPGHPAIARAVRTPSHIALLGNFPPRRCGLATYTEDSWLALKAQTPAPRVDVYAMDDGQVEGYGPDITRLIPQDDVAAYHAAADAIDASGAQILWVQHEFGIFGGESGSYLLGLVNRVKMPVAVTLHTILEQPNGSQRSVLEALLDRAATVIVMAEKGREILERVYAVDPAKVSVIPHGIPDRPLGDAVEARARLGLPERPTVLTFGLLSPDKGIADMVEAMPGICAQCPDAHYIVLGATHPHLVRIEGETYRETLIARVAELGLQDNVSFVDRFVELDELTEWLTAADVYVTPYRNPAQITSGTLSYAIGLGKAVVSTPYIHATEILSGDHGKLVAFRNPEALATAVGELLTDTGYRAEMSARAYARGRTMTWPRNAEAVLAAMTPALRQRRHSLGKPVLTLSPIERMTDGVGMLQHSVFGIADRDHGYCIDDNARGLLLMAVADDLPVETRIRYAETYASFVQHGWNPDTSKYRNFMSYDRRWLEDTGSEDSNGRTLWALGVTAARAPSAPLRNWAKMLYDQTIGSIATLGSIRTRAFAMLGAAAMVETRRDADSETLLRDGILMLSALLARNSRPDWAWFEIVLSYDNTRLPEALIRAGLALDDADAVATGLEALDWIAGQTSGHDGMFQPVGTEGFGQSLETPALFDQQPLEAWAMIDACEAAWTASGDAKWLTRAEAAHDWFLGRNTLGVPIVDPETGECGDGLTSVSVNANNGAESVIAWQMGRRAFVRLSEAASPVQEPAENMANAA